METRINLTKDEIAIRYHLAGSPKSISQIAKKVAVLYPDGGAYERVRELVYGMVGKGILFGTNKGKYAVRSPIYSEGTTLEIDPDQLELFESLVDHKK